MRLRVLRQSIQLLSYILVLFGFTTSSSADDTWLSLQAPRFDILSQLSEKETRVWAEEFDKFVTALQLSYDTDDKNLLPLTIVLFKNNRQFSSYKTHTESGQAKNVVGVFANLDDRSIIGLPGLKDFKNTRRTIFHEAVHWFMNSQNFNVPLWLEEGIAEVFSTFEIRNGKGRWGLPIQAHVDYLNYKNMQPTRNFLFTGQDEALHKLDTYYPQAWAMAHYLMFGSNSENRKKLSDFLSELGIKSTKSAFESAFGITYEEFDKELQRYIQNGKYNIAEIDMEDSNTDMKISRASNAMTGFILGRLAVAGGNFDLGKQHAEKLISVSPSRPEGYELLAVTLRNTDNRPGVLEALDKAISRNSVDSQVYYMKAAMLLEDNFNAGFAVRPFDEETARHAADMYKKSIVMRPSKKAFEGFAVALMNVNSFEEDDRKILELGTRLYPQEGSILAGFAALDIINGDINSFNRKLEQSYGDFMNMSGIMKSIFRGMQQSAYHEWLLEQLSPLMQDGKFEEAERFLTEQNTLSYITADLQKVLDNIDSILYSSKRLYHAEIAMKMGNLNEARTILEDIEKDETIQRPAKSTARRIMSRIEKAGKYLDEKKGKQ